MKKLLFSLGTIILISLSAVVFGSNVYAAEKEAIVPLDQNDNFHEGETPLKTYVDKKTGVVVEVYPTPNNQNGLVTTLSGDGNWDSLGTEVWETNASGLVFTDGVYQSNGGDYMFRIPAHSVYDKSGPYASTRIVLKEQDIQYDDVVFEWEQIYAPLSGRDYVVRGINEFVDGGAAEFYTVHRSNYTSRYPVYVEYFD